MHNYRHESSSSTISNIANTEHRYRLNYRRNSCDDTTRDSKKFSSIRSDVVFSQSLKAKAAAAAAAVAAAASVKTEFFSHFHKQNEFDLMAKNHLDLFTINNNNENDGPKNNRSDDRKREQRCFLVSKNSALNIKNHKNDKIHPIFGVCWGKHFISNQLKKKHLNVDCIRIRPEFDISTSLNGIVSDCSFRNRHRSIRCFWIQKNEKRRKNTFGNHSDIADDFIYPEFFFLSFSQCNNKYDTFFLSLLAAAKCFFFSFRSFLFCWSALRQKGETLTHRKQNQSGSLWNSIENRYFHQSNANKNNNTQ